MSQFVKVVTDPQMLALEVAGLRWLADCGARVPRIVSADGTRLVLERIVSVSPTPRAARAAGAMVAGVHSLPLAAFGGPPPGTGAVSGWVGRLPVPFGTHRSWPQHYVVDRLRPAADAARLAGGLGPADSAAVEQLCEVLISAPETVAGPPQAAAPIHGDLWAGNVLWQDDGAVLIDPAAVAGHPETDLAMLQLFGLPLWEDFLAGYQDVRPLAVGWERRVPLHQVFPLLVHAALFGGGYGAAAGAAARRAAQ